MTTTYTMTDHGRVRAGPPLVNERKAEQAAEPLGKHLAGQPLSTRSSK